MGQTQLLSIGAPRLSSLIFLRYRGEDRIIGALVNFGEVYMSVAYTYIVEHRYVISV